MSRRGLSLVELLAVLLLLVIAAAVVAPMAPVIDPPRPTIGAVVDSARRRAVASGRARRASALLSGVRVQVYATPDGVVIVDSAGRRRLSLPGDAHAPR